MYGIGILSRQDGGLLQDGPAREGTHQVPLPSAGSGRLQHSQDWPGQEPEASGIGYCIYSTVDAGYRYRLLGAYLLIPVAVLRIRGK